MTRAAMRRTFVLLASFLLAGAARAAEEAGHAAGGGESNLFAGDIGNAVWTLVIFLIVLFILGKYAWGPILAAMQAREGFIRESLERAKRDREEAEARLREYEERLAQSRAEASAIVDEGRRDAEVVKRQILEEARQEGEKMIERAKREIQIATDTATKELYTLAARLATDMAGRVLGRELTAADHERLIAESIDGLDTMARH